MLHYKNTSSVFIKGISKVCRQHLLFLVLTLIFPPSPRPSPLLWLVSFQGYGIFPAKFKITIWFLSCVFMLRITFLSFSIFISEATLLFQMFIRLSVGHEVGVTWFSRLLFKIQGWNFLSPFPTLLSTINYKASMVVKLLFIRGNVCLFSKTKGLTLYN